ncbi:MAG: hypothetical protein ANABAC_3457 [Anaerolineae bacterium]|nr:MAG: hypothetical protein ANABAC_3457 [Anaerolineae bacterium]
MRIIITNQTRYYLTGNNIPILTHTERIINDLRNAGKSKKEISQELNLSPQTVRLHLRNINQKARILWITNTEARREET